MPDPASVVGDASTVLLCGPSLGSETRECCTDLLEGGVADGREVVWVTYTRSPEVCVASMPDDVAVHGVLAVGDAQHWETSLGGVTVDVVSTPEDLTALGIKLSRLLSADDDLVVCFDSVTAMCQYVERDTAYGFLHTIRTQLHVADARAHFHLDPTAHAPSTVDLFASLCDAVVDVDGDEQTVKSRAVVE